MQVKCTSCGAQQEVSEIQNCSFCGSIININNLSSPNFKLLQTNNENVKILLYDKSIQVTSSDGDFFVLLKNISAIRSSIFDIYSFKNKTFHQIVFLLAAFVFCFIFYDTLIPHSIDKSGAYNGYYFNYSEKSEVSFPVFIVCFLFFVIPLLIFGFYAKGKYEIYKEAVNSDQFIILDINGVSPKKIVIGNKVETENIYNTLKEKIEFVKMRQE